MAKSCSPGSGRGRREASEVGAFDLREAPELLEHCRAQLASYKCPKSVDFVDALPRADSGKLYKRLLREQYWAGHDSLIA